MGYAAAPGMYFCVSNSRVICLDILADRYFGFSDCTDRALQALLTGRELMPHEIDHLSQLCIEGILVANASSPAHAMTLLEPQTDSGSLSLGPDFHQTVALALGLLLLSGFELRARPLSQIVERIRTVNAKPTEALNTKKIPRDNILAAFAACRKIMSAQDKCLKNALALFRLLRIYGHPCQFVIGVRSRPFAAHAWVQDGAEVLIDELDNVRLYTPIFTV